MIRADWARYHHPRPPIWVCARACTYRLKLACLAGLLGVFLTPNTAIHYIETLDVLSAIHGVETLDGLSTSLTRVNLHCFHSLAYAYRLSFWQLVSPIQTHFNSPLYNFHNVAYAYPLSDTPIQFLFVWLKCLCVWRRLIICCYFRFHEQIKSPVFI